MSVRIKKVIFHKHDLILDLDPLTLTNISIDFDISENATPKEKYLIELLEFNSKRNAGKLANFNDCPTNSYYLYTKNIFQDENKFVHNTRKVMEDLVSPLTPGSSTSGNYMFALYHYSNPDVALNSEGVPEVVSIDEVRFAMLKFELQDSQYINYITTPDGKTVADITIENNKGLPQRNEKLKKGVFLNNYDSNKLPHQLQIIDRESAGIAQFFTQNILNCSYMVRHKDYLSNLRKVVYEYVDCMKKDERIDEDQEKHILIKFGNMIACGNIIDQTSLGTYLFSDIIDEEDLGNHDENILNLLHKKGLTFNKFPLTQQDVDSFLKKQYIHISKESFIKYSKADEDSGIVVIPQERDPETDKYIIKVYLDESPVSLIRSN